MITAEHPIQNFIGRIANQELVSEGTREPVAVAGEKVSASYFEFKFILPQFFAHIGDSFSDNELLVAAEKAGTFKFWDAPEEDIYNDRRKK